MSDLTQLAFNIESLHQAYADGLGAGAVLDEVGKRIDAARDPGIFLSVCDPSRMQAALAALPPFDPVSFPLWGIPFAVKDNIDVEGLPTSAACREFTYQASSDAFAVAALKRAGGLLLGKTNLDQFATGLVGVRTPFPIPRNAIDPAIVPGGSSSGSAVAVARGIVTFALGTDTAGSGRVPAALNNIVGLKPSLGAVSASGVVPACRTLDTISVLSLTVEDAYRVFQILSEYDPTDPYARAIPAPPLGAALPQTTIGVPQEKQREFFGDAEQAASYEHALEELQTLGAEVVPLDFAPFFKVAKLLYHGAWVAERYAVVEDLIKSDPGALHPVTYEVIKTAEQLSSADVFRDLYRLEALKRSVAPLISSVDMLCVPSVPRFFTLDEVAADPVGTNTRLGTYTNFVNLLDLCGIAVPVSARRDGRPGSVTLLARAGRDSQTAALASVLHRNAKVTLGATGWPCPAAPPPAAYDSDTPNYLALAVVGAHMSGLALNHELVNLGAQFQCRTTTANQYRLYCLPGGPPLRPGLVRCEDGRDIDLEVWMLPRSKFGDLLAAIPAPLGIGTISLADGALVKGFVCEAHAVGQAEDISDFGGWRAYLASQNL